MPLSIARDPPRFLFYNLVRGCNLRCTHCDFWKLDESPTAQASEQIKEVIREYQRINPRGVVVTCGGEPTLIPAKFWGLCQVVRDCGLKLFTVQNGTYIKNAGTAERMLIEGPDEITISLDGPDAATHDAARGVIGSFDLACRAVRHLYEARSKLLDKLQSRKHGVPRVYVMTILCNSLHGRMDEFFDLVLNQLGADKLKLNIVAPTFNAPDREGHVDPYFEREHIRDWNGLAAEITACDAKYGVRRNPKWLDIMRMYSQSVARQRAHGSLYWSTLSATTDEQICNAGERNITMGDDGMMRSCFSNRFPGVQWKAPGDMASYWYDKAPAWRQSMGECRRLCGISHSNRREPSTMDSKSDAVVNTCGE